jgi:hypothetical protein
VEEEGSSQRLGNGARDCVGCSGGYFLGIKGLESNPGFASN